MTSGPRALRDHADALRRAADRFTLLRLRVSNAVLEVTRSSDPRTRRIGEDLREQWSSEQYAELGRIATGLRASARRLDEQATVLERSSGRRMGGYAGAGFLGRGDDARHHVDEVARFVGAQHFAGTQHGASIGGFPLSPQAEEGFLPHPSHAVGAVTPDYEDQSD
ncbi:hypothetical protein [Brachybacterium sp. p3-SID957]|uniref:hypothetical protein n=1 Tax=Brachybacterium sp. p3-SID957 TaxID=2916049 RepID=UPI00223A8258|nr:hypothetical protein [Brachybacterium sp. p3-SID957]MCT1774815.1 hypothetical protein [Brachybacterium sp. p3-SID957]